MSGLSPKIIEEDVGEVWMGQVWRQADERGEGNEYTGNHYTIFCLYFCMFEILHFIFKKAKIQTENKKLCDQPNDKQIIICH